jgi:type I restriction enzyme M protein
VDKAGIKATIYEHPEFAAFIADMQAHFTRWRDAACATLKNLVPGFAPKDLTVRLSEELLAHYTGRALIKHYNVYQHFMDYWAATMQDDCYLIAADGWSARTYRIIETDKKGKTKDKGWTCDLVPKPLIVARYFSEEQAALDALTADLETVSSRMAELEEEHGGDEGAFAELDKINKAGVSARLKEIRFDASAKEEAAILNTWLKLCQQETDLKKKVKEAEADLDTAAYRHYPKLTEAEIKTLVVEDKWLASLETSIHGEMDRISQALTRRVRMLAERYAKPLPQLVDEVEALTARVDTHLRRMGMTL